MKKIGGNLTALLQVKDEGTKNAIGEKVHDWDDVTALTGWLDLMSGDSNYSNFSAKIQESTHIFICGFKTLENLSKKWVWNPYNFLTGVIKKDDESITVDITSENARMIIRGLVYDVLLIDNPMNMDEHLEIYLRFVGGQS